MESFFSFPSQRLKMLPNICALWLHIPYLTKQVSSKYDRGLQGGDWRQRIRTFSVPSPYPWGRFSHHGSHPFAQPISSVGALPPTLPRSWVLCDVDVAGTGNWFCTGGPNDSKDRSLQTSQELSHHISSAFFLWENNIPHSRFLASGLVHRWPMDSYPVNHLTNLAEWRQIDYLKSWKSII